MRVETAMRITRRMVMWVYLGYLVWTVGWMAVFVYLTGRL